MSDLTSRLASLTPEQRALLMQRLRKREAEPTGTMIPSQARDRVDFPLSFAQQRLWFLDQFDPGSSTYNIPMAFHLDGELHVDALRQGFVTLIARHEALRTTFESRLGQAAQVIHPAAEDFQLQMLDLRQVPECERDGAVRTYLSEEAQRPFDMAQGPLVRASLLKTRDREHVLFLNIHHIVSDGWSMGVLFRELEALYQNFSAGTPATLPALPVQYADFSAWQRQWLQGEILERQLAYWKHQFPDMPPVLQLPTDRPRPAVQTYRGATATRELPVSLANSLEKLSREQGVTLFTTLLAAFKVLLYRYTNQEDITVGTPSANRARSEIEGLIGFFVNTLALRTNLGGNPTFREVLNRVREVAMGGYAHQELPFERLMEILQPERDLSHIPLVQTIFTLQNAAEQSLRLSGLQVRQLNLHNGAAKFDLTVAVTEGADKFEVWVEYNVDLFDRTTIDRMLGHFQLLLESVAATPDQSISSLGMLTQAELDEIVEWNSTDGEIPDGLLHTLFADQVALRPNQPAVIAHDRTLTYAELHHLSNQVGRWLRDHGARPNTLVGVVMEKGWEQVAGILGVLVSGAAYLPLDPASPRERLWYLMERSEVSLVLTQSWVDEKVEWPEGVKRLIVHEEHLVGLDGSPLSVVQQPQDLAYVIFTSGSTGQPKGVMLDHRGPVNTIVDYNQRFGIGPTDSVINVSALNFDWSVYEIFGLLAAGGAVVMPREDRKQDPSHWAELMVQHRVTMWTGVPALMDVYTDFVFNCPEQHPPALRTVQMAGDWIPVSLPDRIRKIAPGVQVFSMGGATEASVVSICYPIGAVDPSWKSIPYGRPMVNQRFYILNDALEHCPVRVPGQLYIGGIGVALGYWRDPERTAASFIIHPKTGERLYRTGDLGCWMPDGNIEFLGRVDFQVKIRGYRIELGEIESTLLRHPAVSEAVATVREDSPGDKRLVAYLVLAGGEEPTSTELRAFVKTVLPDYMVPSAFVVIDHFPLTANGKLDRRALPAPPKASAEREVNSEYVAPQTPVEHTLVQIWAQVLGQSRVGITQNFFELGGESILGIQIIARANQAGLRISPKQLFEHQTIAELALVAGNVHQTTEEQGLVTGPVMLTPAQHWFFEQDLPERHHWNQSLLFEVEQSLDPQVLESAIARLMEHHDALRLRFVQTPAGVTQYNAGMQGAVPFTRLDLSTLPESEQKAALTHHAGQAEASLNLADGPLLRAVFFDLGAAKRGRLLVVIHHLATDGVSWRILMEDLETICRQLALGQPVRLPAKTTAFQRWAQKLHEYAQSENLARELDYWSDASRAWVSPIPVDNRDGSNTWGNTDRVEVALTEAETGSLLQDVPAAYHTQINDVLLAALGQAYYRWTGERSLLIDLEGHGREDILPNVDLSRTVGWFTSIYPVLLDLSEIDSTGVALKSVKEQVRRIPNRGIGYGVLRYLRRDTEALAELQSLPEAQMSFNYLGQFGRSAGADSLFTPANETVGPEFSLRAPRRYLLDITASVSDGCLRLSFVYSASVHFRSTVEELASRYVDALRVLISHCQSADAPGFTPSDFPEAQISQSDLDKLIAKRLRSRG